MPPHDALSPWESFYVIVGSSAAALTGLQFVVMALIADTTARAGTHEIGAFATPNVVHFCAVLLFSSILSAPWPSLQAVAIAMGVVGFLGVGYAGVVWRRTTRTKIYKAVLEDWIWHVILPFVAHVTVVIAAFFTLSSSPYYTMFAFGGASLLLLFVGIHNAWDTTTYITTVYREEVAARATVDTVPPPPAASPAVPAVPAVPAQAASTQ